MNFSDVLHGLKNGLRFAREGWNGKDMFIYLVQGSTFVCNRPPLLGIYPEGTTIIYRSHIDMRTADGSCVPWLASQTDLLEDDWVNMSIPELDSETNEEGEGEIPPEPVSADR